VINNYSFFSYSFFNVDCIYKKKEYFCLFSNLNCTSLVTIIVHPKCAYVCPKYRYLIIVIITSHIVHINEYKSVALFMRILPTHFSFMHLLNKSLRDKVNFSQFELLYASSCLHKLQHNGHYNCSMTCYVTCDSHEMSSV
jgi:hypothetical protein